MQDRYLKDFSVIFKYKRTFVAFIARKFSKLTPHKSLKKALRSITSLNIKTVCKYTRMYKKICASEVVRSYLLHATYSSYTFLRDITYILTMKYIRVRTRVHACV